MYIVKNAFRCIGCSKGRNILIAIIALVIAISACIGLSIRQAAETATTSALDGMSVTATISYDRQKMMDGIAGGGGPPSMDGSGIEFDKDLFLNMMGGASSLTLDEYLVYAEAPSVEDFYYTLTAYFNGSENLEAITTSSTSSGGSSSIPGGLPDFMSGMGADGDFTVIGYSSDASMTDFQNGTASVTSGSVFAEGTKEYSCIISQELATYNSLSVGDTVTITNPNRAEETYELTIVGIYASNSTNDYVSATFNFGQDPANRILMSTVALQSILNTSEEVSETVTDEETNSTYETAISGSLSATYVLADVDAYYAFEAEVRAMGLDEAYAVSSDDISSYENSLTPLNSLSKMAGWFLIVILVIGAVILVVLNIFNIRERKYEIGVLTAMGMKKWKVAAQFLCEILVVTMVAVIVGTGIGALCSVPVTNALLENQVQSQSNQRTQMENRYGRPDNMGGGMTMPDDNFMKNMFGGAVDYVTEIDSAMNLTVAWQMIGVGLLLTLVAGAVSVLFVTRYDPLKILANRD